MIRNITETLYFVYSIYDRRRPLHAIERRMAIDSGHVDDRYMRPKSLKPNRMAERVGITEPRSHQLDRQCALSARSGQERKRADR